VADTQPVALRQTFGARQNQRKGLDTLLEKSLLRSIFQEYILQANEMERNNEESREHTKPSLTLFYILNLKQLRLVRGHG
jgi:hypothetical protein